MEKVGRARGARERAKTGERARGKRRLATPTSEMKVMPSGSPGSVSEHARAVAERLITTSPSVAIASSAASSSATVAFAGTAAVVRWRNVSLNDRVALHQRTCFSLSPGVIGSSPRGHERFVQS